MTKNLLNTDILIAGGGIIGLTMARALSTLPNRPSITLLEKDSNIGNHSSALNSGVLHSGIYYAPGSYKSKHCVIGNAMLTKYCLENKLPIFQCGKLIVAKNEQEVPKIHELHQRAITNRVPISLVDEQEAKKIEPHLGKNVKFPSLWSPSTSVANPKAILQHLEQEVKSISNINFIKEEGYGKLINTSDTSTTIETTQKRQITTPKFINCAGLYADKIAHEFGEGLEYGLLPLKGLYMIDKKPFKEYGLNTLIYPLPPLTSNNFLGVHTTLTTEGKLKLGPTAVPAFWREHYEGSDNFKLQEFLEIMTLYMRIGFSSKFFFYAKLLLNEVKKSYKPNFLKEAQKLINIYDAEGVEAMNRLHSGKSAIRTQLIDKRTLAFLNDFHVVERGSHVHFMNMASPGWTSSFSIAEDMKKSVENNVSFESLNKAYHSEKENKKA